jgi:hypothetical protein
LKYATVEWLQFFTEQLIQVPEIQAPLTSTKLGAWLEETKALGQAHFDFINWVIPQLSLLYLQLDWALLLHVPFTSHRGSERGMD